jgi:hypothetical protein
VCATQGDHLLGRLDQAAVRGHLVDQHEIGRVTGQASLERVEGEHPGAVDGKELYRPSVMLQPLEVRTPLSRSDTDPGSPRRRPDLQQHVQRSRRALDEGHALLVGAQQRGDISTK